MGGKFGVIAEGWIDGRWYSSLGKAGVDKNGQLKNDACITLDSALKRALRSCANKVRAMKNDDNGWVEFRDLPKETQILLIENVSKQVNLEMLEPMLYRAKFSGEAFQNYMSGVCA